ncbi:MAG TPA: ERAP1-like C-terminal domain-containing protein, partial [Acidimicrobiales bacterium]|nr:ERAP1-like C-terminal domain-containing protein [Acidimicrobiales bacterium]
RLSMGLYALIDGALTRTRRLEVEVADARADVPELVGVSQPNLILLNDDDFGYVLIRFDPRSLDTVTSSIGKIVDPLARAVCWVTAIDMAQQAELSLSAFAQMVSRGLETEPSVSVVQSVHRAIAQVMAELGDPRQVSVIKEQLAAAALRLIDEAAPGSDHQLAWAQLLGWTATSPAQLERVAGLLDGSVDVPGLIVDAELRWALLGRLATVGTVGDAVIDEELQRDPTDAGQRRAATCRASLPDAAHKAAAWTLLTESDLLGVQGVLEVSAGFTQSEHADLLAPYAQRYFDSLGHIWSAYGDHFSVVLSRALFPSTADPRALIEQIDAFLSAEQRGPGLVRVLIEFRDVAERSLRSRALDH